MSSTDECAKRILNEAENKYGKELPSAQIEALAYAVAVELEDIREMVREASRFTAGVR